MPLVGWAFRPSTGAWKAEALGLNAPVGWAFRPSTGAGAEQ